MQVPLHFFLSMSCHSLRSSPSETFIIRALITVTLVKNDSLFFFAWEGKVRCGGPSLIRGLRGVNVGFA